MNETAEENTLPGNLYQLLLKNVSRDDPLSSEEVQELKNFRSTLTTEQWKGWLQFARDEKHALRKQRKRSSPPKLKSLVKDPVELLETLSKLEHADEPKIPAGVPNGRRNEVSWSDHNSSHHIDETKILIKQRQDAPREGQSEEQQDAISENRNQKYDLAANQANSTPVPSISSQQACSTTNDFDSTPPTADVHPCDLQKVQQVAPQHMSQWEQDLQHNHEKRQQYHPPRAQFDTPTFPWPEQQQHHHHHRDMGGVSLERNRVVGRGGSRPRPASAPRSRPLTGNSATTAPGLNEWGAAVIESTYSPRHRRVPEQQQLFDTFPAMAGPPSVVAQRRAPGLRPTAAQSPFHRDAFRVPHSSSRELSAQAEALDLASAAEIARSTAFRLDSAYSAAQCLLSSMSADHASSSVRPVDWPNQQQRTYEAEGSQEKLYTSMSILTEMMSSMEKSRAALSQLSDLNAQPHQHQHLARASAAAPRFQEARQVRETRAKWAPTQEAWRSRSDPDSEDVRPEAANSGHYRGICGSPVVHRGGPANSVPDVHFENPFVNSVVGGADHYTSKHAEQEREQPWVETGEEEASFESTLEHRPCTWQPGSCAAAAFDAEEQPSGFMSPSAALSARYGQSRAPGDFSPRNKQLAGSAIRGLGLLDLNPVNSLQSQLFEAADTSRRSLLANTVAKTTALAPGKQQSAQYSYNSAGYVWEGIRYSRAQGPVSRVCIAHGPLVKAFDDYPVRVDVESSTVDVVWREARIGDVSTQLWSAGTLGSPTSQPRTPAFGSSRRSSNDAVTGGDAAEWGPARNTVLRRERFAFDDVFTGPTADGRLAMLCRQRTRKALEGAHNLAFLCLGCGDAPSAGESAVEPPVSTLLGGGGGTGLISSVVDEIFRFTRPLTASMLDGGLTFPGSFPTVSNSPFVASKVAFEQMKSKVTLSAIILSDRGEVFDLLASPAQATGVHQDPTRVVASLKRRKSDGRVVMCNASRLQLQTPSDFDRIMGLLLGKRTALQGVLTTLQQQQRAYQREAGMALPSAESMYDVLASIDPWAAFNSRSAEKALESSACASTMLVTVSVTGGVATSGQTSADFNFISPCGKNWFNPGADVNILAELLSGLPNLPPPSLLKSSPLGLLLMDPRNPATDFVNIVAINRESTPPKHSQNGKVSGVVVNGALNSLRIIAQLTQ